MSGSLEDCASLTVEVRDVPPAGPAALGTGLVAPAAASRGEESA